jgi:integrase
MAETIDPLLATAVALAALTGLRRGELLALRWSDVDLEVGSIKVERAITVIEGTTHIGPTKTHQVRRVALDEVGIMVLRKRLDYMIELSERADSTLVDDPYILSTNANGGRPVNPDTLTHRFSALCRTLEGPARKKAKKQGTPLKDSERWPFRLHDLRHFSVTTLIARSGWPAGTDPYDIGGRGCLVKTDPSSSLGNRDQIVGQYRFTHGSSLDIS